MPSTKESNLVWADDGVDERDLSSARPLSKGQRKRRNRAARKEAKQEAEQRRLQSQRDQQLTHGAARIQLSQGQQNKLGKSVQKAILAADQLPHARFLSAAQRQIRNVNIRAQLLAKKQAKLYAAARPLSMPQHPTVVLLTGREAEKRRQQSLRDKAEHAARLQAARPLARADRSHPALVNGLPVVGSPPMTPNMVAIRAVWHAAPPSLASADPYIRGLFAGLDVMALTRSKMLQVLRTAWGAEKRAMQALGVLPPPSSIPSFSGPAHLSVVLPSSASTTEAERFWKVKRLKELSVQEGAALMRADQLAFKNGAPAIKYNSKSAQKAASKRRRAERKLRVEDEWRALQFTALRPTSSVGQFSRAEIISAYGAGMSVAEQNDLLYSHGFGRNGGSRETRQRLDERARQRTRNAAQHERALRSTSYTHNVIPPYREPSPGPSSRSPSPYAFSIAESAPSWEEVLQSTMPGGGPPSSHGSSHGRDNEPEGLHTDWETSSSFSEDSATFLVDQFFDPTSSFGNEGGSFGKLRFWQSLIVELGIRPAPESWSWAGSFVASSDYDDDSEHSVEFSSASSDASDDSDNSYHSANSHETAKPEDAFPSSLTAAKRVLKDEGHINLIDYLKLRAELPRASPDERLRIRQQLKELRRDSRRAPRQYTRATGKYAPKRLVKQQWLDPLMVQFF